jgi:glycosyltransferase involved in cell wall biosynthesis
LKVDVVMITKNSVYPSLKDTVSSIFANIPVSRLLVIDGGSRDGTREFLAAAGAVIIDDSSGTRATSRQKGMDVAQTELFAFVDSDVLLPSGWFEQILPYFDDPKVGGVSSYPLQIGTAGSIQRGLERLYGRGKLVRRKPFGGEASVLRKSAVQDFVLPPEAQTSEDSFLGKALRSKGYTTLTACPPVCFHQRVDDQPAIDRFQDGQLARKYAWTSLGYELRQLALSFPEAFFIVAYTGDFHAGKVRVWGRVLKLGGWLRG